MTLPLVDQKELMNFMPRCVSKILADPIITA